ncbi:hypothetical protein NC652_002768 [Populus alba x Populus x berolinensis]|nr:hypothetical protein NC652_002768 [Populus alba x Populus x berolinensis]
MLEEMENTLTDMIESGSSAPDLFTFNSITGGLWEQWAARQDKGTKLTGALHEDYCGRATFKYRVRILR